MSSASSKYETSSVAGDGTRERGPAPVQLLWTGGWDSTYRLLDLVLGRRVPVQPWYVKDEERASMAKEIEVMAAIREAVAPRDPEAATLLYPTRFVRMDTIAPEPDLTAMYAQLRIGSQYDWLARLARQQGLHALELSVEKRNSRVHRMLWQNTEPVRGAGGETFRLKARVTDPDLELFRHFAFPILHLTKQDLYERARHAGFLDLMRMTWFCHDPRGGRPCGSCTPCLIAIGEGMGGGIPLLRRSRGRLRLLKKSVLGGNGPITTK